MRAYLTQVTNRLIDICYKPTVNFGLGIGDPTKIRSSKAVATQSHNAIHAKIYYLIKVVVYQIKTI